MVRRGDEWWKNYRGTPNECHSAHQPRTVTVVGKWGIGLFETKLYRQQKTSAWTNYTCNESKHAVRQNNGKSITYCWFLFFTTKFPDELGLGLCEKMGSDGLGLWEKIGRVFDPRVDWLGLDTGCDCWLVWLLPKDIWGKDNSWGEGFGNHYHVENDCGMCTRSMHGSMAGTGKKRQYGIFGGLLTVTTTVFHVPHLCINCRIENKEEKKNISDHCDHHNGVGLFETWQSFERVFRSVSSSEGIPNKAELYCLCIRPWSGPRRRHRFVQFPWKSGSYAIHSFRILILILPCWACKYGLSKYI